MDMGVSESEGWTMMGETLIFTLHIRLSLHIYYLSQGTRLNAGHNL